ncbi:MAG TPA: YCF48-related protein [Gemmatimonadaceae bacterium]|nr:YCF48-related protein [Gemmatimonadaceae bacterium]
MYASCLFCNGHLGRNDQIAAFPVGRRVAFDPLRGRLWVICPGCARWNLAPLEERWEALDECERRFRSTSLRISIENIGLAELPGGMQLVRIGKALPTEVAAWRYGRRLLRHLPPVVDRLVTRATERGVAAMAGATDALVGDRGQFGEDARSRAIAWLRARGEPQRILHVAHAAPGARYVVRARHLARAGLLRPERGESWRLVVAHDHGTATLAGDAALSAAGKLLAALSPLGASDAQVRLALAKLDDAGNPHSFFSRVTALALRTRWGREPDAPRDVPLLPDGVSVAERLALQITNRSFWARGGTGSEEHTLLPRLPFVDRLALEMAVNEDSERRAMRGELRALLAAWRDAEEVAAIADAMFLERSRVARVARVASDGDDEGPQEHRGAERGAQHGAPRDEGGGAWWRATWWRAAPLLRRFVVPVVVAAVASAGMLGTSREARAQSASRTESHSAAAWVEQHSGTTASLRGISAVSDQVAWASGSRGTVLRTVDGGRTWERRVVPGADSLDFRDVEAFGADTAYVLSAGTGAASRIYRTTDGGRSWTLQITNADPDGFWDALAFWDAMHGLALGDPADGDFTVYITNDGGASWTRVSGDRLPNALPGEAAFAASGTCLVTQGDSTAWFATGGGAQARVFRTADRGRTWSVAVTPIVAGRASAGIFSIAFGDALYGVAVGGDYTAPDSVWVNAAVTEDGGQTWHAAAGEPGGYRSAVAMELQAPSAMGGVPSTRGAAATDGDSSARGAAALIVTVGTNGADYSMDGGATWSALGGAGLNALALVRTTRGAHGVGTGWAVGERGRVLRLEGGRGLH